MVWCGVVLRSVSWKTASFATEMLDMYVELGRLVKAKEPFRALRTAVSVKSLRVALEFPEVTDLNNAV